MNSKFVVSVALVLCAHVPRAYADVWTLDAALAAARENNPSLRAADTSLQRAQAGVRGENARYGFHLSGSANVNAGQTPRLTLGQVILPYSEQYTLAATLSRSFDFGLQVSLQTQVFRSLQRTIVIPTSAMIVELGPGFGIDSTLSLTQPLLRGMGTNVGLSGLRAAEVSISIETLRLRQSLSALMRDTTLAYYELWYAEEALRIQSAAQQTANRQLEDARARESVGVLAMPERLQFETRARGLAEAVAQARAQVRVREQELRRLTGVRGEIQIQAPNLAIDAPTSESAVLDSAFANSPELTVLRAQVVLSETQSRVAGEEYRPRLDVQGQFAVHGLGNADAGNALTQYGSFTAVTGLVTLSGELDLDDTRQRAAQEQASLATSIAERNWEAGRDSVQAQLRSELENIRSAEERVELATSTTETAHALVEAEEARLSLGVRTATQVVLAADELRNAELRVLRARVDLASAMVRVQHHTAALQ